MLSFPHIERELRVQSRRRSTYDLRIWWGLAVVGALGVFIYSFPEKSTQGRELFSALHLSAAVMIFAVSSIGAADTISRERREGTLGLLMLTRLTPANVALGKLAAHLIRLAYFSLMLVPFMLLPILMGGLEFRDALLSSAALFAIVSGGIAGGLIASSLFMRFGAALIWALLLGFLFPLLVGSSGFLVLTRFVPISTVWTDNWFLVLINGIATLLAPIQMRDDFGRWTFGKPLDLYFAGVLLALSAVLLLSSFFLAARRIAGYAIEFGETKQARVIRRRFFSPIVLKPSLRKMMARKLSRNPLNWLEYRSAGRRATRWGLLLVILLIETAIVIDLPTRRNFFSGQFDLFFCFLALICFKSCGSFQEEKETGAFELLLVTPITENQLLSGRLRAVANYYLPSLALLVFCFLFGLTWATPHLYESPKMELTDLVKLVSLCGALFSTPICGLYFALRCKTFLSALAWTAGATLLAPIALWTALDGLLWMATTNGGSWGLAGFYVLMHDSWWVVLVSVISYHTLICLRSRNAILSLARARRFVSAERATHV